MASRYRSLSRPAFTLIKSTLTKPTATPKPSPSLLNTSTSSSSSAALSRQSLVFPPNSINKGTAFQNNCFLSVSRLGCVQSLLPLHSAVSSARLTSCLGVDSRSSRSLSQGMLCSANPGKWVSARLDKRCRRLLIDGLESSFILLRCFFMLIVLCFQQFGIIAYKVGRLCGYCFSEILENVRGCARAKVGRCRPSMAVSPNTHCGSGEVRCRSMRRRRKRRGGERRGGTEFQWDERGTGQAEGR
ncbi:hypothetical protein Ahy_B10g104808 [Arachis hypogaea]|uniref:Uncharacterized protein n=1 Tax=Arachis hypogaea TaxID=3818 RepID=A0A444X6G6_ARAHY|nr:hypothetical protein Ahy_B10g104808 [Arachis hypogaea]